MAGWIVYGNSENTLDYLEAVAVETEEVPEGLLPRQGKGRRHSLPLEPERKAKDTKAAQESQPQQAQSIKPILSVE